MLGKLLCKLGFHKWRELYGEMAEYRDDFFLRYCFRCGAYHNFLDYDWKETKSVENWRRRTDDLRKEQDR